MTARNVPDALGQAKLSAHIFDLIGEQVAADVLADARRGVPVDTGELQGSLEVEKDESAKVYRVGSTDVEHSVYVELGTRKMAAQPYLRPALYKNRAMHE